MSERFHRKSRSELIWKLERLSAEVVYRAKQSAAKDRFFAMLSHELRTPLTPILATVSALQTDQSLPEHLRLDLEKIRRNVELEARLIDDLLDATRLTHNKIELRRKALDVHAVIHEVLADLAGEFEARHIAAIYQLAASRHHTNADAARLKQVLINLLKNALKFTAHGGRITMGTKNEGDWLSVTVTDTGMGIDPVDLKRLFRPFEQATLHDKGSGLGLGLAIAKGLVEAHGGKIWGESKGIGHGARFGFDLLTCDSEALLFSEAPARSMPTVRRARLRLLLVEDHADSAQTFAQLLRRRGYDVKVANSMNSAVHLFDEGVDLLVSDIGLPDGTGYELLRQLKLRRPLFGIAVTGFGGENDVRASLEAGFSEHLTKPLDIQDLVNAIERVAQGSGAQARVASEEFAAGPVGAVGP